MKARKPVALFIALLCCLVFTAQGLQLKDKGEEVKRLKLRLFDLGYLDSVKNANATYTKDTQEQVKAFQLLNGLPQTGVADEDTLALLYSKTAIKAPLPEDRPHHNLAPDSRPQALLDAPMDLTEEGFLVPGSAPFIHKDRENGLWVYWSDSLKVEVFRLENKKAKLEWFEAYVTCRDPSQIKSALSQKGGHRSDNPLSLAKAADAILAINDDYYTYRVRAGQRVGVIIRNGVILSENTTPQNHARIPSLEVLALFSDGRMQVFDSSAHTGQEYVDLGVKDTFAFGPALVREGEVPRYFYSKDYRSYQEPRCAVGMISPGRYVAMMVTGRKDESHGATFGFLAEKMLELGAKEALNLDGGGSATMIFMDEIINKSIKNQVTRSVSGILAFCDD